MGFEPTKRLTTHNGYRDRRVLFDGLGVRALIRDPAMGLENARRLAAKRLAPNWGLIPRRSPHKLNRGSAFKEKSD